MQPNDGQPGAVPPSTPPEPTPNLTPAPASDPLAPSQPTPSQPSMEAQTPFFNPVTPASQTTPLSQPSSGTSMGDAPTPPKKKLPMMAIIIAIAAVVLIGGGVLAYSLLNGNTSTTPDGTSTITGGGNEDGVVVPRTDGTLDLSETVATGAPVTAQEITAGLNEQVNLENGFSIMVTKLERNFSEFQSSGPQVSSDEEIVAVTVVVGNRSAADNPDDPRILMGLQAPSARSIAFHGGSGAEGELTNVSNGLKAGQQESGRIVYIVKNGESPLKLNYFTYGKTAEQKQAKMSVTFTLTE